MKYSLYQYWGHSMDCPHPEGCNCGASQYNQLLKEYRNSVLTLQKLYEWADLEEPDGDDLLRLQDKTLKLTKKYI